MYIQYVCNVYSVLESVYGNELKPHGKKKRSAIKVSGRVSMGKTLFVKDNIIVLIWCKNNKITKLLRKKIFMHSPRSH